MKLSEFIMKYREEHGLSQRQFAEICDVSNSYISMLEKERNPKTGQPIVPSMLHYVKIANGMNISVQDLFSSIDDAPVDMATKAPSDGERISDDDLIFALWGGAEGMDAADLADVKAYAEFLRAKKQMTGK